MKRQRPINADAPETPPPTPPTLEQEAEPPEPPELEPKPEPEEPPEPEPEEPPKPEEKVEEPETEPEPTEPEPEVEVPAPPPPPPSAPRRRRVATTPLLLAGLVVIAIGFILAAFIGGGGGKDEAEPGSGPVAAAPASEDSSSSSSSGSDSESAEALGFPGFATDNTTRIGGADPAENAAAAALAVYPSTTPSLRPQAVTLVGEEDWPAAIAASVLVAAPVGAPILFADGDGLPDASAEALAALAPKRAFAIGDVDAEEVEANVQRVRGGNAAAEAAAIAGLRDELFASDPKHFVIAPSNKPEMAMPAAAWAARSGDPVLFAGPGKLPTATAEALRRDPDAEAFVLGPPSGVSDKAMREIGAIAKSAQRISGENPVGNSVAFARFAAGSFGWNVNDPGHGFVLARSDSPLDAGAAAPLSAAGTWGPLLLTDSAAKVPPELRNYFLDVKPGYTTNPTRAFYNHVWVIGDQEAIDVNQQAEVNELAELAKIGGGE